MFILLKERMNIEAYIYVYVHLHLQTYIYITLPKTSAARLRR